MDQKGKVINKDEEKVCLACILEVAEKLTASSHDRACSSPLITEETIRKHLLQKQSF